MKGRGYRTRRWANGKDCWTSLGKDFDEACRKLDHQSMGLCEDGAAAFRRRYVSRSPVAAYVRVSLAGTRWNVQAW